MPIKTLIFSLLWLFAAAASAHDDHVHLPTTAQPMDPVDRLVLLARSAQARHDFDHALSLLDRATNQRPINDDAWLLQASIHLVKGDAPAARRACRKLRQTPLIVSVTCHARTAVSRGEEASALRMLNAILHQTDRAKTDHKWLAWAHSVAGDAARDRDPEQAIAHYQQALEQQDNDQVRAALADVLIEHKQFDRARDVLADAHGGSLALTIRRLLVAAATGQATTAAIDHYHEQFQRWIAEDNWEHAREMARFYLDVKPNPALARRLASINLTIQREREDQLLSRRAQIDNRNATENQQTGQNQTQGKRLVQQQNTG